MERIIFELTMPNVGSWNGQWTGANNRYTICKKFLKKDKNLLDKILDKSFYYNFGDGWGANIKVRKAEPREKATNRFYGYEWMINSILEYQKIRIEN